MILIDTSVLIDFFRGRETDKTRLMDKAHEMGIPYGISAFSYMELLRGARTDGEFAKLREYLSTQAIYYLPEDEEAYSGVAYMYFDLLRRGVTPRNTVDLFIAFTAIANGLMLLHDDRDFDMMASYLPELKMFEA
ncbi:MAG: PIN domain-containing protein [Clostridiales Family XIII bacterium]|jgi:predicted nucleic acid-binding protein|nr:PIN domain-containing protein [Clostridiales Family XIII bacterium]